MKWYLATKQETLLVSESWFFNELWVSWNVLIPCWGVRTVGLSFSAEEKVIACPTLCESTMCSLMQTALKVFQKSHYPKAPVWSQAVAHFPEDQHDAIDLNSHLIAGLQQRSSLSCTEQISSTSCSSQGKKIVNEKGIAFISVSQSLILCCFTLQTGLEGPSSKSGSGKSVPLNFQVSKGLPLLLLSVEKVLPWCCMAFTHKSLILSSTSDERKEAAHAAVGLVLP